jgi:hypothetical protein
MIKIYKDAERIEEVTEISFGEVEVGDTQEMTLYVWNDSTAQVKDLVFTLSEPEVVIVEAPKVLKSMGKLILSWSPSLELLKPLSITLTVSGKELYTKLGKEVNRWQ